MNINLEDLIYGNQPNRRQRRKRAKLEGKTKHTFKIIKKADNINLKEEEAKNGN